MYMIVLVPISRCGFLALISKRNFLPLFLALVVRHFVVHGYRLFEWRVRLCLCYSAARDDDKVVIWSMKEYGDENSWTKEIIMRKPPFQREEFYPIKVFKKDSDHDTILFAVVALLQLFIYLSDGNGANINKYDHLQMQMRTCVVNYIPSFPSLTSMGIQNVASF